MLNQDQISTDKRKETISIKPDPSLGSLLKSEKRLGIFDSLEGTKEANLSFWDEWDRRSAR